MEISTTYNLSISKIKDFFPPSQVIGLGEGFCMIDVRASERLKSFEYPCRFDGVLVVYCISGRVKVSVNLKEFEAGEGSLFITVPNNILKVCNIPDDGQEHRYVALAMSQEFVSDMKLDFKRVIGEAMMWAEHPVVRLQETDKAMLAKYMELMAGIVRSDMEYKDEAVKSMASSMFCLYISIWKRGVSQMKESLPVTTRSKMVFEQFIRLVTEYHTMHRNVGFYADKLCLTPKYLSKLIKTASGRSAPEWIDSYVILESKNLLKYSDMAIKEIVYRLNFPNQSVFYKFFKARTGMTPSEYRNS